MLCKMAAETSKVELDAKVLSAGMMYRSRRRRRERKGGSASASISPAASFDTEQSETLVEYVTRGLDLDEAAAVTQRPCMVRYH